MVTYNDVGSSGTIPATGGTAVVVATTSRKGNLTVNQTSAPHHWVACTHDTCTS